jgi:hypothetical protein
MAHNLGKIDHGYKELYFTKESSWKDGKDSFEAVLNMQ